MKNRDFKMSSRVCGAFFFYTSLWLKLRTFIGISEKYIENLFRYGLDEHRNLLDFQAECIKYKLIVIAVTQHANDWCWARQYTHFSYVELHGASPIRSPCFLHFISLSAVKNLHFSFLIFFGIIADLLIRYLMFWRF